MSEEKSRKDIYKRAGTYVFSTVVGAAASILLLLACSLVMYAVNLPPEYAGAFGLFALGGGCMASGFVCCLIKKRGGIRHGFRCAVLLSGMIILVSLITGSFDGSLALTKLVTAVITGCTGGIIGVNLVNRR